LSPDPIRVVYLINSLRAGGAERFLCDLVTHLDRDRFQARILCLYESGQFAPQVEAAELPVEVIGVKRKVAPANWFGVWRRLGGLDADVVHTHLHEAAWYGLPAAFLRRVPVRISHLHSSHWNWPRKLRWLDRGSEAFASKSFVCSSTVEEFANAGLGYPTHKVELVPNGIDVDRFRGQPDQKEARRALDLPQDCPILICVASLTEEKGQTYLLNAMQAVHAELPDAHLLLVGRDRGKTDLNALAVENGLGECVTFLGSRDDIPLLMAASDVSVLPSLREGLPLSLVESAAAGLPSVATSVGGIPEVVEDGVGGILVPPRDPVALAEALLILLRDPERGRSMGEAARRSVEGKFDIRAVTDQIEQLYISLLARGARTNGTFSR
jgi:glycosyltransferase involved in cell wall biosynthesis